MAERSDPFRDAIVFLKINGNVDLSTQFWFQFPNFSGETLERGRVILRIARDTHDRRSSFRQLNNLRECRFNILRFRRAHGLNRYRMPAADEC